MACIDGQGPRGCNVKMSPRCNMVADVCDSGSVKVQLVTRNVEMQLANPLRSTSTSFLEWIYSQAAFTVPSILILGQLLLVLLIRSFWQDSHTMPWIHPVTLAVHGCLQVLSTLAQGASASSPEYVVLALHALARWQRYHRVNIAQAVLVVQLSKVAV